MISFYNCFIHSILSTEQLDKKNDNYAPLNCKLPEENTQYKQLTKMI